MSSNRTTTLPAAAIQTCRGCTDSVIYLHTYCFLTGWVYKLKCLCSLCVLFCATSFEPLAQFKTNPACLLACRQRYDLYKYSKGWSEKMRPHETLTNANFKVLYTNIYFFFIFDRLSLFFKYISWIDTNHTFHGSWNFFYYFTKTKC